MSVEDAVDIALEVLPVAIDGADMSSDCCSCNSKYTIVFKLILNIILVLLTAVDIITGFTGFMESKEEIDALISADTNNTDTTMQLYAYVWMAGLVSSIFIEISNIVFLGCSTKQLMLHGNLCCVRSNRVQPTKNNKNKPPNRVFLHWQKVNFFFQFVCEDCMVSIPKILIAFKSPEAEAMLRTETEQIASIVSLVVTLFELLLVIIPVWVKIYKKQGLKLIWSLFCLLAGCAAASPAVLTMLISLSMFEVYHDDSTDFNVNLGYLVGIPLGSFAGLIVLGFAVCVLSHKIFIVFF